MDQKISNNYAKHNDEFIFNQFKKTLGKTKATAAAAAYAAADKVGEDADAAAEAAKRDEEIKSDKPPHHED